MLLVIALSIFSIGTYLVWPSRWNIPAHINVGFILTAYVAGLLLTNTLDQYPRPLVEFYTTLMEVGAGTFVVGLVVGAAIPRLKFFTLPFSFSALDDEQLIAFTYRRVVLLGLFSVAGLIISFRVMGFVPMFAQDPMVAKYLRGTYQDAYQQVAVLYRGSEQIIVVTLPMIIILYYVTRRRTLLFLALLQVGLLSLTLIRGYFGGPVLIAIGVIAASRGLKTLAAYVVVVVFSVALFSASTYYAAHLLAPNLSKNDTTTVWQNIASGTPDVADSLNFLEAFLEHPEWTYGRTFMGGMVPFHYRWNPAIWSLRVEAEDPELDANEAVSGGLRLPAPVVGYTAFGWPGALLVSLLSGLAAGYTTNFARRFVGSGSPLASVLALGVYNIIGYEFISFYTTSLYSVFAICIMLIFTYPISFKLIAPATELEPT